MKKKIIFITEALWIGGIESALIALLNNFDYDTYDVTLLVLHASLELVGRIPSNCKLLIADRECKISFKKRYKFLKLYHLTENVEHPSILHHCFSWTVPLIRWMENICYIHYVKGEMKGQIYNTAVIYSDRVSEIAIRAVKADQYIMFYHHGAMRQEYHDEIAYRRCKSIIAVSPKTADELSLFRPKYADKITWMHNIVDVNEVLKGRLEQVSETFPSGSYLITTCGRLSFPKGVDLAVSACSELVRRGYTNIQWVIVGDGPERRKLERMIIEQGIETNMQIIGMKINPYPYLAMADLVVQPSRFESYCISIKEAMFLLKPVLATSSANIGHITNDVNGFICDANSHSIANSIERIMRDPEKMHKVVQSLKQQDMKNENETNMKKMYQILEE